MTKISSLHPSSYNFNCRIDFPLEYPNFLLIIQIKEDLFRSFKNNYFELENTDFSDSVYY